ncbi:MAG: HAMP domain-containing protein, partial [Desulfobacterales bacterium]
MFNHINLKNKFHLLMGCTATIFIVCYFILNSNISPIRDNWTDFQKEAAPRQKALLTMKAQFGYGGAIHNFKNYVLRSKEKYVDRVIKNHAAAIEAIENYRKIRGITKNEKEALATIESTFTQYRDAVNVAQKMFAEGKNSQEVDAVIKINDGPAIKAFDVLERQYETMTVNTTDKITSSIVIAFKVLAASLIFAFLMIAMNSYGIQLSIVKPLRKVARKMEKLKDGSLNQERIEIKTNDEIGLLGKTFNELLEELRSFIDYSQWILKGELNQDEFCVKGDFRLSLEKMLNQAKQKKAADEGVILREAFTESSPYNILFAAANDNFNIQYANSSSINTLKTLEKYLPIKTSEVIGKPIDIFHPDPNGLRKIVSDPQNLPHKIKVNIGPEIVDLDMIAIIDKEGNYRGPMLTWAVITEIEKCAKQAFDAEEREKLLASDLKIKVNNILGVVTAARDGDLTEEIAVVGKDDIGRMGEGLSDFLGDLRKDISKITETAFTLASSSEEMSATSQEMASNAEQTSAQANVVSGTSKQVSLNVQTVVTGAEEMSDSINEIAKSSTEAAKVSAEAVKIAEETTQSITRL